MLPALSNRSSMDVKPETIELFQRDGFVAVSAFYHSEELASIEAELDRFKRECIPELESTEVYYEVKGDASSLKQIQRMQQHDDCFAGLMDDKPRRLAEQLLGEEVVPKNLQYFNKPPLVGQNTPPHQDGYYFMLEPCRALTMWLALDEVDEENGCVRYVSGSHREGLRPHNRTQTLGFSQGISDFGNEQDKANEVICRAQPGDLLAHQAMTIHRAGANNSPTRSRRALGFIFYGVSAREDAAAHKAYQQKLDSELAASGKI